MLWEPYPPGPAGASRCQKLAFGLQRAGSECFVLARERSDTDEKPLSWSEDSRGIRYLTVPFHSSKHLRNLNRLIKLPGYILTFANEFEKSIDDLGITHVILYGLSFLQNESCLQICKRKCIPIIVDCVEWWQVNSVTPMVYVDQEIFRVFRLPMVDGIIGISTMWMSLARSLRIPFINIPATCWDPSVAPLSAAFEPRTNPDPRLHILYVGSFLDRDLPAQMIKGFEIALSRGVDAKLTIVGRIGYSRSAKRLARTITGSPHLREKIDLVGFIAESDARYWQTLNQADAFVLLRADTHQSRACFPTRVPPFMCAGKPLITSRVADLGNLLTDHEDALILSLEDQPKALSEAIQFLANHRDQALRIGKAGSAKAIELFSCIEHGHRLHNFLGTLAKPSIRD